MYNNSMKSCYSNRISYIDSNIPISEFCLFFRELKSYLTLVKIKSRLFQPFDRELMFLKKIYQLNTNTGACEWLSSANDYSKPNWVEIPLHLLSSWKFMGIYSRVGLRFRNGQHIKNIVYSCIYNQYKVGLIKIQLS